MKTSTTRPTAQELRNKWLESKRLADSSDKKDRIQALIREKAINGSYYGIYFTLQQMEAQGLEGLPHVDAKTFQGWKRSGFIVKKGEHSTLSGITWITKEKDEEKKEEGYMFPKEYKLFHRSQVEEL
jgi:hypothetical protein